MDIYALDGSRMREHIVDRFESAIWTERYAEMGEFQLLLESTQLNRLIFHEGRWLVQNGSYRVMVVETYEDVTDNDGRTMFKPSGRSLEYILDERLAAKDMAQVQANGRWTLVGTPGDVMKEIFQKICIEGLLDPRDIIPNITMDPFPYLPEGTNVGSPEELTLELEVKTLYATFRDLSVTYSIGFALLMDPETGRLHFQLTMGTVRTSGQSEVDPIIFSPELDNLSNPSELVSSAKVKNVAIVVSDYGSQTVYADNEAHLKTGFERRVLLVRTSDIKESDTNKPALLQKIGQAELAKHRRIMAFDGEVPQRGYKYGIDYFMGDIVEMRKRGGGINYMKATEQIFIDDLEGERSYPTLSLDSYIAPGAWYAVNPNLRWHDVEEGVVWPDM